MTATMDVPYAPLVMSAGSRLIGATLRDYHTDPGIAARACAAAHRLFGGLIGTIIDLSVEAADFGQEIIYPLNSTPHPNYSNPLIKDVDDYRKISKIELKTSPRMQRFLEYLRILVEKEGLGVYVGGFVLSPLSVLGMMRGVEALFRDCVYYPRQVMLGLERITEVLVEYVKAQCDIVPTGVMIDILNASQTGLPEKMWEEIEGPFVKELANAVRSKGRSAQVHNCGSRPYFHSIIRFVEPDVISFADLPYDCASRKELKRRYGKDIVLMGYVDTAILFDGTPQEVIDHCKGIIEDLAEGGKFILAPGCEFPPNGNLENAMALAKAAKGEFQW